MLKHLNTQTVLIFAGIFTVAVALRIIALQVLPTLFFFDQARDLILVQELVTELDFKLLGPSASGTNDTIYHGVLYYYILAPLFLLTQGHPLGIQLLLGSLTATAILPIALLTQKMARSTLAAMIVSLMYAFSSDAILHGTWLSNPSIATLTVPWFFLSLWLVMVERKTQYLWLTGISLAFSIQSVIFAGYLALGIIPTVGWLIWQKKHVLFAPISHIFWGVTAFFVGVSSMILAQYRLYKAGIFSFDALADASTSSTTLLENAFLIAGPFSDKLQLIFPFTNHIFTVACFIFIMAGFVYLTPKKTQLFYWLSLALPAVFLLLLPKDSLHSLIGLEGIFLIPLATVIGYALQKKTVWSKALGVLTLIVFASAHLQLLYDLGKNREYPSAVQPGMYLDDQIALIDSTYKQAGDQPFSINTYSNPYQYATTWTYLYEWYGLREYGYLPTLAKQDQVGMFGYTTLEQSEQILEHHFAIYEPSLNTPEYFYNLFVGQQSSDGNQLIQEEMHGTIKLEYWQR